MLTRDWQGSCLTDANKTYVQKQFAPLYDLPECDRIILKKLWDVNDNAVWRNQQVEACFPIS